MWIGTMESIVADNGIALPCAKNIDSHPYAQACIQPISSSTSTLSPTNTPSPTSEVKRLEREQLETALLARGATVSNGSGNRAIAEAPDPLRTCFERDRDRIIHSPAFRRLAGKTQVFIFPDDYQRTRLTHALEVAQVATAISRAVGLNVALSEAIALGHDCGHGPGGHASEDALSPFLVDGFDHAPWGADVTLAPLNLCAETLDGIRNHSWTRPMPSTPEGMVVRWADRCAYCAHDLDDALHSGIVSLSQLPASVSEVVGTTRSQQLNTFIRDIIDSIFATGIIGMSNQVAHALGELRRFNYEHIYNREESVAQGEIVMNVLQALVNYFVEHTDELPNDMNGYDYRKYYTLNFNKEPTLTSTLIDKGDDQAVRKAVSYIAGMTDRFAFKLAIEKLGWKESKLPNGV